MFLKMLAFEWRYYTRQPSFYVTSLVFFLIPFLAMVSDSVRIGGGGNVLYNGSFAITQTMLIMGIFSMFLVVNFIASTATRNDTTNMSEILYSKPINPLSYQLGRFFGSFLVILTVFAMVPLGTLIGSVMPWLDAERLGPTNLSYYITTYVYLSMTTLFVLSCVFYAVGLKFKTMLSVYVMAMVLFTFYIISGFFVNEPEYRTIAALTDPFGLRTFADVSRYWTAAERNTQMLEFSGVLMQNRLIWLAVGLVVLAVFGGLGKRLALPSRDTKVKKGKKSEVVEAPLNNKIDYRGNTLSNFLKFKLRTKFEVKQVFSSPAFYILLAFSMINIIAQFFLPNSMYGTNTWPLTFQMVDQIQGNFSILFIVVIAYYSAEVVWRERSSGMGDIVDSMPVFNMTFWLSKLIAVCLVVLSLYGIGMLTTIAFQLIKGHSNIEIGQYLTSLVFFYALPLIQLVVLSFLIQVLSPNKYIGMMIFAAYFILSLSMSQLGFEHNMWNLGTSPIFTYSDMNGYGWYLTTQFWYMTYWTALAVAMSVIGYAMWQRGPQVSLKSRFKLVGYQLGTGGKATVAASLLVFVLSGSYIYYNTRVLNEYYTTDQTLDWQAEYEKTYNEYVEDELPEMKDVHAKVDIHPTQRQIEATVEFTVENTSDKVISRFLVNRPSNTPTWSVEIEGGQLSDIDPKFNTAWFEFEQPMQPGDVRQGQMKIHRVNKGFKDRNFDVQLVENGTFLNNYELFPTFGVNQNNYIADRHERRKRDLAPPVRAHKLEDEEHHDESFFGKGVGFINFEATVSTDLDQIAIAPGYLQKEWTENDRRYFHYKMDAPMVNFYSILSARYEVKKVMHNGVSVEVYYHPTHDMNVDVMIESTKDSIDYFSEAFGEYQHKQMRIIEFPRYRGFAQSFANTVPYSEDIGFVSDLRDEDNIDPVYYVTAHELAHQWWGHQVGAANVQGSAIISEALSQYSAIMVMAKRYGDEKMRKFLKYELDAYLRGRTAEILEEMPLFKSESQQYIHYRKGSVVMMAIKDQLGEEAFNAGLKSFLNEFQYRSEPYPTTLDLMRHLYAVSNEEQQAFIAGQFEDIAIYDLKATGVETEALENGRHMVTLTVDAKRYIADGKGEETETDFSENIEIVLFNDDPNSLSAKDLVLYTKKHLIKTGQNVLTIEVDKLPKFVGIDPFVKLIDRDSEDNVLKL